MTINAPTAETTVPNLDAWDTDDKETENKSEPENKSSSAKSTPTAGPIQKKRPTKMNDNNSATPAITKYNTKRDEKVWEVPLMAKYHAQEEEKEEIQAPSKGGVRVKQQPPRCVLPSLRIPSLLPTASPHFRCK